MMVSKFPAAIASRIFSLSSPPLGDRFFENLDTHIGNDAIQIIRLLVPALQVGIVELPCTGELSILGPMANRDQAFEVFAVFLGEERDRGGRSIGTESAR